jgi:hypothetical protein
VREGFVSAVGAVYASGSSSPFWSRAVANGPSGDMSIRMWWSARFPPHTHTERFLQAKSLSGSPWESSRLMASG